MNEQEQPLLSTDLNTIETTLPIVTPGIYELRITKSEIINLNESTKVPSWKLTMETTAPTSTVDGKPVDPGHPIFSQTQLAPTGKATQKMVVQNVAQIVQALRPRLDGAISMGSVTDPIPWHKQAEGRMIRVRVEALPARENPKNPGQFFRATNQISEFLKN